MQESVQYLWHEVKAFSHPDFATSSLVIAHVLHMLPLQKSYGSSFRLNTHTFRPFWSCSCCFLCLCPPPLLYPTNPTCLVIPSSNVAFPVRTLLTPFTPTQAWNFHSSLSVSKVLCAHLFNKCLIHTTTDSLVAKLGTDRSHIKADLRSG